ncbi:MAG: DUF1015 family protein [Bacteroidales bacterium]|jgi:uncharacterized protein (DUF1015 family)|nr:DUF1015 family protein [Bacteroidales bacterium]
MVKIKPFAAIRPPKEIVREVASLPYDVLNSKEAQAIAGEKSLLHIIKPEIDFDPIIDEHSDKAYEEAVKNFKLWQERKWLIQDPVENYYVYSQTMNGHTQFGLVVCANVEDYISGKIKKHELTRKEKEDDRMIHVKIQNANLEPVFFSYKDNDEINTIVSSAAAGEPEYDFTAEDGVRHRLWVIGTSDKINRITEIFSAIPAFYVADGHHRTAAAARVGLEKRAANPHHTGNEEYNYFMAVIFPESNLRIMDYNRVIRDLNGMNKESFLEKLSGNFDMEEKGDNIYKPCRLHEFSMYLNGKWYSLRAKTGTYDDTDPIGVLDVTILSRKVLDEILGIKDLRTSERIDFVGGIRGLGELKKRVDSGEMAVAFALYPVSMKQLTDIADSGNIMPPKTTWFEPKLRSGITIHKLDRR